MLNAEGEDILLENVDPSIIQAIETHLEIVEENILNVECDYIIDNNTEVLTQNNGECSPQSRVPETPASQQQHEKPRRHTHSQQATQKNKISQSKGANKNATLD